MAVETPARPQTASIKDAAVRLGVHENTIRNWIDRGILRSYRLPSGHRRLLAEEVERLEGEMFSVPTSVNELSTRRRAPKQGGKVQRAAGRLP
jgi:excisionase family DNA binding protein